MRRGRDPIRREGTRAPNHRGWEYRVWPDATMTTWDTGEFPWMALFRRGPRWRWEARMTRSIHVDPRRGRAPTKRKAVDKARASIDIAIAEREANKARGASALDGVHPMTDIFIKFRGDDVIDVPGFEEELFELAEGDGGEVGGTSAVRLLSRGVSVSELLRQGAEESVQKAPGIARKAMREGSGVPIKSSPGPGRIAKSRPGGAPIRKGYAPQARRNEPVPILALGRGGGSWQHQRRCQADAHQHELRRFIGVPPLFLYGRGM